jgi:hypothetical protein
MPFTLNELQMIEVRRSRPVGWVAEIWSSGDWLARGTAPQPRGLAVRVATYWARLAESMQTLLARAGQLGSHTTAAWPLTSLRVMIACDEDRAVAGVVQMGARLAERRCRPTTGEQ